MSNEVLLEPGQIRKAEHADVSAWAKVIIVLAVHERSSTICSLTGQTENWVNNAVVHEYPHVIGRLDDVSSFVQALKDYTKDWENDLTSMVSIGKP